jgi:hypothetical protein
MNLTQLLTETPWAIALPASNVYNILKDQFDVVQGEVVPELGFR